MNQVRFIQLEESLSQQNPPTPHVLRFFAGSAIPAPIPHLF